MKIPTRLALMILPLLLTGPALAAHHKMPPEMIHPCKAKAEGDACQFTRQNGDEINGRCALANDTLFCHPEGQGREKAAKQLMLACDNKSAGDRCVISGQGGNEMAGQCIEQPSGKLMCHMEKQGKPE
ncbi:hypothetical protein KUV89_00750 [Marinobacter hydrocarbonoclasticus]|nr:hypothetical protein [Marinobacter nauticus]